MREHPFIIQDPYLRVFNAVYWANFRPNDATYNSDILANRRAYCREHELVRTLRCPNSSLPSAFDHPECYRDGRGRVRFLASPYGEEPLLLQCGGTIIAPLYTRDATTYEWVFDDHWALHRFGKRVSKEYVGG